MTTRQEMKQEALLILLLIIVILLMVAIAGLFIRMNQLQQEVIASMTVLQGGIMEQDEGLETGVRAPDFALVDTVGQTISLHDFEGKRLLLVFSSVHCPGCISMFPHLLNLSESSEDVDVVMISQGSGEENRSLIEEQGFTFPILAWDDAIAETYEVPGTPFFYVIDTDGTVVNSGFANSEEQIRRLYEQS